MPIVQNVLLEITSPNRIMLSATNLVSQFQASIPVETELESLSLAVNAKKFYHVVSGMSPEQPITLMLKDGKLRVKSGRRNVGLPTISDISTFPRIPTIETSPVSIDYITFSHAIKSVLGFAQSQDDKEQSILRGINVQVSEVSIKMMATNKHNTGYISLPINADQEFSITVFESALNLIFSTFDIFDTLSIRVDEDKRHILFSASDDQDGIEMFAIITALISEDGYPNLIPVIKGLQSRDMTEVVVNNDKLAKTLSAASFIEEERISFLPYTDTLSVSMQGNSNQETFEDEIEAVVKAKSGAVICNRNDMLKATKRIQGDIKLRFTDTSNEEVPVIFITPVEEQEGDEYIQCLSKYK